MNKEILVPDIGDFEKVEIIEVLVKPGDNVKKNDPLITLESDKSSVEVPSTEEGVIENINVKIGDKVSKGDLILSINSQNGETNTKIPPVTEKIIEEAEKTLTKDKIIDTQHSIQDILITQKQVAPKKENRIIVTDNNDIDPLETKEWIESLNAVVNNFGNERAHYLLRQLIDESYRNCLLYTSPSPRDAHESRMPSSA